MAVRSDVNARLVVVKSINAVSTATAAVNGASVDMRAYPGYRVLAVAAVGTQTEGTLTFTVEDSADDSSFATLAPVAGAALVTTSSTDDVCSGFASYQPVPGRPYLRIVSTETVSVTTAVPFSACLILVPPTAV